MDKKPTNEDLQRQIAASKAAIAAFEEAIKAANAEAAEWRKKREQIEAEREAAQAERDKAADERLTRTEKMLEKLTLESGNAGNRRGFSFERSVYYTLQASKKLGGIRLKQVDFNAKRTKKGYQYDMVGINGKYTLPIEAKVSLSVKGVRHFAEERLPFFYREHPQYDAKGKDLKGVMIYERTDVKGAAVDEALRHGLLVYCADSEKQLTRIKSRDDIKEHHQPRRRKPRPPSSPPPPSSFSRKRESPH